MPELAALLRSDESNDTLRLVSSIAYLLTEFVNNFRSGYNWIWRERYGRVGSPIFRHSLDVILDVILAFFFDTRGG